jgi:2-iminobutanoate/2-iminopropanoate deaminase
MQSMSATLSFAIGLLATATSAVLAAGAEEPSMHFYNSPAAAAAKLPFSQAVCVGDVLYLSGALGNVPGTLQLVAGGIEAETRQTMENIGAVLKANGLSFDDIFKCTVMLADMAKWGDFNKVYVTYQARPAAADAELGEHLAWFDDDAGAIGRRLVPVGRQAHRRPRIA